MIRRLLRGACALALFVPLSAAHAQVTTFRFTDLDLRDPHAFVNVFGCRDVTNTSFAGYSVNGSLQTSIQTDGNGDGYLDRSYLLIFSPLAPGSPGGTLRFRNASCTAPMSGTTCSPDGSTELQLAYTNGASGSCLTPIAGTTTTYSPAITSSTAPCFATGVAATWTVDLGGIPILLRNVQIGATYTGTAPGTLTNGLIRGFLTETDANNTTIPASFPLIGGKKVSSLLPGGTGCCATHDARDFLNGVRGWWFYLNFTAAPVNYTGSATGVGEPSAASVRAFPNPFRPSVSIHFSIPAARAVTVTIVDPLGREVKRLADGWREAGTHELTWDGRDEHGSQAAAGIYFLRVSQAGEVVTRRLVLLR